MSCVRLINGQNSACDSYVRKYYQQVVLINKDDVADFVIQVPKANSSEVINICRYRVYFKLKDGKSGVRYTSNENSNVVTGSFSRTLKENIPQYKHSVNIPIFGVQEATKCILNQLDLANYFAVLQTYDNLIEVFGFDNGLILDNFDFNIQNSGGNILTLTSNDDSFEDFMPLVYFNTTGTEVTDFDNNFEDVPELPSGDFNDDFNDDFYI